MVPGTSSSEEESPNMASSKQRHTCIAYCAIGFGLGLFVLGSLQLFFSGGVSAKNSRGEDAFLSNDRSWDASPGDTPTDEFTGDRVSNDWSLEELEECSQYMESHTCDWTVELNCPDQDGGQNKAVDDNTAAYNCCCEQGYWRKSQKAQQEDWKQEDWSTGDRRSITVYHQTSPEICDHILSNGFRVGKGGFCGKAMYFARTPQATAGKAITSGSHGGCMLQAVVEVGKQRHVDAGRCGAYSNAQRLHKSGADSIVLNVLDPHAGIGDEIIIFEPERVRSVRKVPFKCSWMCHGRCQRHWPKEGCIH